MKELKTDIQPELMPEEKSGFSRRKFLGYAGAVAGAGVFIASCKKEDDIIPSEDALDLGRNDEGLLNLLFVIQQVEADFYSRVISNRYNGMSDYDFELFAQIAKHEIAHREVLRNYLKQRGTVVQTNFEAIDFSNKVQVLENAELIENTCVASMNEVGRLLISGEHVSIVLKMASVEAKHAGTISNIIRDGAYFNTVDASGSEQGALPSNTVIAINRFLATKVNGSNLPNL